MSQKVETAFWPLKEALFLLNVLEFQNTPSEKVLQFYNVEGTVWLWFPNC